MRDVQCGKVVIRDGLALAPMAGVTDRSFRRVCRRFGAAYTVSEMVSAKALCLEQAIRNPDPSRIISGELASVMPDEMPMAVQLFGHEPEVMAEAAARLASGDFRGRAGHVIPAAVDINMGCPVRKIVGNGEGSALMRDPALAGRIVQAVVRAADPLPVTVKLRAGFDESSLNAPELARVCEAAGAAMLCIHGRTRAQGYAPGVNRAVIRAVKQAVRIPVLANGDIYTPADALSMLAETGCDGIMVARGAMGRPWLFAEIRAALRGEDYTPPEMLRSPLDALCLQTLRMRLGAPSKVLAACVTPPEASSVERALLTLTEIQAVREVKGALELTPLGNHLADLPVDCRIGKMLVFGCLLRCVDAIATIAAFLSQRSVFRAPLEKREEMMTRKRSFAYRWSDHLTLLRVYQGWCDAKRRRDFCRENFINYESMLTVHSVGVSSSE